MPKNKQSINTNPKNPENNSDSQCIILISSAEESPIAPASENLNNEPNPLEQMKKACKDLKNFYEERIARLTASEQNQHNPTKNARPHQDKLAIQDIEKIEKAIAGIPYNKISRLKQLAEKDPSLDFTFYNSFRPYFISRLPAISSEYFNSFIVTTLELQTTINKLNHSWLITQRNLSEWPDSAEHLQNSLSDLDNLIDLNLFDNIETSSFGKTDNNRFLQIKMIIADLKIAYTKLDLINSDIFEYLKTEINKLIEIGNELIRRAKQTTLENLYAAEKLTPFPSEESFFEKNKHDVHASESRFGLFSNSSFSQNNPCQLSGTNWDYYNNVDIDDYSSIEKPILGLKHNL